MSLNFTDRFPRLTLKQSTRISSQIIAAWAAFFMLGSIKVTAQPTDINVSTTAPGSAIPSQHLVERDEGVWFGLYTTYWVTKKLGYYGEYHLRRSDFMNRMSKLYLRFGLNYKVDTSFRLTAGVVNRFTWSNHPELATEEAYVPEYRFWEQALFSDKYFGLKLYHQIRIEQRWKRSTSTLDPRYYYYNRFRYKFLAYGPIFGPLLETGSLFFCLYNEIFIQAGEKVEFNYFEDNRSYVGLGYGLTDQVHLHLGYMKSFGQISAVSFKNENIVRLSLYHKLSLFED